MIDKNPGEILLKVFIFEIFRILARIVTYRLISSRFSTFRLKGFELFKLTFGAWFIIIMIHPKQYRLFNLKDIIFPCFQFGHFLSMPNNGKRLSFVGRFGRRC